MRIFDKSDLIVGVIVIVLIALALFLTVFIDSRTCNSPEITQTEIRGIVVEKNVIPENQYLNRYIVNIDVDGKVFYIRTMYETYMETRLNTKYTFEKRGSRWYIK